MTSNLHERREWFEANREQVIAEAPAPYHRIQETCPCCGYPTLHERGGFEICVLCWWEDDGQDDHDADEVLGGPNQDLSLAEARENYRRSALKYRAGRDTRIGAPDSAVSDSAKAEVIRAFDEMREPGADYAQLWRLAASGLRTMDLELKRALSGR